MSKKILEKLLLLAGMVAIGFGASYLKHYIMAEDDLVIYSNNKTVTVMDDPIPVKPVKLQSNKGEFGRDGLLNKWSFLFFGYTHCPDVCPSTLTLLQQVDKSLKDQHDKLQTVFVTLDPERDSPVHMGEYVAYFNKRFIGLSGQQQHIDALAKSLGVMYEKGKPGKDGYEINHTASIFLVNPMGEVKALFSTQFASAENIVADTRRLMSSN